MLVVGPHSITTSEARHMVRTTKARFREVGVELQVQPIRRIKDLHPEFHFIRQRGKRLEFWANYIRRNNLNKNGIVYVVLPPMYEEPPVQYYLSGGSGYSCTQNGVAVGNAESVNALREDRIHQSTEIMVHNIAHILGAFDSDDIRTIMNTDMKLLPGNKLPHFNGESRLEINYCLTGIL